MLVPVDALVRSERGERASGRRRPGEALAIGDTDEAARRRARGELPEPTGARLAAEVDEYVPAEDHVHVTEPTIGDEIMGKEGCSCGEAL